MTGISGWESGRGLVVCLEPSCRWSQEQAAHGHVPGRPCSCASHFGPRTLTFAATESIPSLRKWGNVVQDWEQFVRKMRQSVRLVLIHWLDYMRTWPVSVRQTVMAANNFNHAETWWWEADDRKDKLCNNCGCFMLEKSLACMFLVYRSNVLGLCFTQLWPTVLEFKCAKGKKTHMQQCHYHFLFFSQVCKKYGEKFNFYYVAAMCQVVPSILPMLFH